VALETSKINVLRTAGRIDLVVIAAIVICMTTLYVSTRELVVNEDGMKYVVMANREDTVGYLQDVPRTKTFEETVTRNPSWRDFEPNSLLYMKAARGLVATLQALGYEGNGEFPLVVLDALAGAVGVALMYSILKGMFSGILLPLTLSIGLGVCNGFWLKSSGVEKYALPQVFMIIAFWAAFKSMDKPKIRYGVVTGIAHALAIAFHMQTATMVLFLFPFMAARLFRGDRRRIVWMLISYAVVAAVVSSAAFFGAWFLSQESRSLSQTMADYRLERKAALLPFCWGGVVRSPLSILRGYVPMTVRNGTMIKAWAAAKSLLVVAVGVFILACFFRNHWRRSFLRLTFLVSFVLILLPTMVSLPVYYASLVEGGIFLLPLVWLMAGLALKTQLSIVGTRGKWITKSVAMCVVAALFLVNFFDGALPRSKDDLVIRKAEILARKLPEDALVISQGVDFVRYVPYYTGKRMRLIWLWTLRSRPGWTPEDTELYIEQAIENHLQSGRPVLVERLLAWMTGTTTTFSMAQTLPVKAVQQLLKRYQPSLFYRNNPLQIYVWELHAKKR